MQRTIFSIFALALVISGCSVDSSTTVTDENLSYTLIHKDVCTTGKQSFKSKAEKCAGLKDHARNNYCAKAERKKMYETECGGDFEVKTPLPEPTPAPTPQPTPWPTATPVPTATPTEPLPEPSEPAIVTELRAEGIEVKVMPREIEYPMPGEKPFRVRLARFWSVLAANKAEVLARKDRVRSLYLATWANYDSQDKELTLTVDFTEQTLPLYFPLVDRRITLEKQIKMALDLGIEVYDGERATDFDQLKQVLTALEIRGSKLMSLAPLVERLKFDSFLSFYLQSDKAELTVNKERFEADLDEAGQKLAPLVPFASFARAHRIALKNGNVGDILEPGQGAHVFNAVAILGQEGGSLKTLAKLGGLKVLEFSTMDYHYAESEGEFRVGGDEKGLKTLKAVVRGLALERTRANELGVAIKHDRYELDEQYLETLKRFELRLDVIRARKGKIKTIELNGYRSRYSYGELTIGSNDTVADLDKALAEIK